MLVLVLLLVLFRLLLLLLVPWSPSVDKLGMGAGGWGILESSERSQSTLGWRGRARRLG
jgi:hypothetical protein